VVVVVAFVTAHSPTSDLSLDHRGVGADLVRAAASPPRP
jgi:hypothetical protein